MTLAQVFHATAALIAFGGLLLHVLRGIPFIVRPMLQADLHMVPKHTLAFSWHWGTVTMVVLTCCFAAPLILADAQDLSLLAIVYSAVLGGLSFRTMTKHDFKIRQMPQWIVFWAAALAGLIGNLV